MSTPIDDFRIEKALEGQNKLAALVNDLERQRDEALAKLSTVHRWIERNHPDGFIDSQSHLQNLDRVADAWHEKLESMREAIKDASKTLETSSRCLHGDSYYKAQSTIAKLKPFFP